MINKLEMVVGGALALSTLNSAEAKEDYIDPEEVKEVIEELSIEHPEIVFLQFREESGNGTSNLARNHNNIFGMKVSSNRPTTAKGKTDSGFATYDSVRDCIIDYALWQQAYARGKTKREYLSYLRKVYIQDSNYLMKFLGI